MARVWLLAAGIAAVLAAVGEARAFPSSRIVYERDRAAEGCPDEAAVRKAVVARLGYDPFFPTSDKTIVARILSSGARLVGEVELIDEHGVRLGKREFSADAGACGELVHAMALSISIAIDPNSAETYGKGPTDAAETEQSTPDAAEAEPLPSAAPAAQDKQPRAQPAPIDARDIELAAGNDAARRPRSLRWLVGAGPVGALGLLAEPALGVAVVGGISARTLRLLLEGQAAWAADRERAGVQLATSALSLAVLPCLNVGKAFGCAELAYGRLGISRAQTTVDRGEPLLLAGARVGFAAPISRRFELLVHADLLGNPSRTRVVSGAVTLWQAPAVVGSAGVALVVDFW